MTKKIFLNVLLFSNLLTAFAQLTLPTGTTFAENL